MVHDAHAEVASKSREVRVLVHPECAFGARGDHPTWALYIGHWGGGRFTPFNPLV